MILSEINIYPIKSLKGISLKEAKIERRGFEFDRRWMLIDDSNKFLTQREFPKMATLETEITENGLHVTNGSAKLVVPFEIEGKNTEKVQIWQSKCAAKIYEKPINEWFSDVLGANIRLVMMPEETHRKVSYYYAANKGDHVSFADAYPFLLIGESSLDDLNSRLEQQVPMNRFRPNLVVSGAESFAEDGWKKIKIGNTVFHVVKPCARCVMTTINQQTGEKQGVEPLKTMASFRIPKRSLKKKILFGQNLIPEEAGEILRVGDKIQILEEKRKPKFS